ncbi:MAG: adenylate/guanylate cyclase domain-containing protein [Pseudomonadota bacterium]
MEESKLTDGPARFQATQNRGLKIGILCRTIAVGFALVWYGSYVILSPQEARWWTLVAIAVFAAIGIVHFFLIGTRFDRWWMKYLLFTIDILTVCALFAVLPISAADAVPQIIAFRSYGIYYLFPVVVLATLSLSWTLVVWSGAVAVAGWWAAFLWIVSGMERTLSWSDFPVDATRQDYENIFLSIDFIGRGNRVEETGLLFMAACILAVAVYRAREVFFAQLRAEEKERAERDLRKNISDTFGRYVPSSVVEQLVHAGGKIPPMQSSGSVLLLDIAGFTAFSAEKSPNEVIEALDRFLSAAADVVAANHGVVITYTGDGLLASFNAPLENETPQLSAIASAVALASHAKERNFDVRIGIASGDLVSGTIGSESRTAFTVYGDTVNRAARLEGLCKELGRSVLFDGMTADAASANHDIIEMGNHRLRGTAKDDTVFSLQERKSANSTLS